MAHLAQIFAFFLKKENNKNPSQISSTLKKIASVFINII